MSSSRIFSRIFASISTKDYCSSSKHFSMNFQKILMKSSKVHLIAFTSQNYSIFFRKILRNPTQHIRDFAWYFSSSSFTNSCGILSRDSILLFFFFNYVSNYPRKFSNNFSRVHKFFSLFIKGDLRTNRSLIKGYFNICLGITSRFFEQFTFPWINACQNAWTNPWKLPSEIS